MFAQLVTIALQVRIPPLLAQEVSIKQAISRLQIRVKIVQTITIVTLWEQLHHFSAMMATSVTHLRQVLDHQARSVQSDITAQMVKRQFVMSVLAYTKTK